MSIWRRFLGIFGIAPADGSPPKDPAPAGQSAPSPYREAPDREEDESSDGPWRDSSPEAVIMRAALGSPPPPGQFRSYDDSLRPPSAPPTTPGPLAHSYAEPAPDDGFAELARVLAEAVGDIDDVAATIRLDVELARDFMIDAGTATPVYPEPKDEWEAEERAIMRALSVDDEEMP